MPGSCFRTFRGQTTVIATLEGVVLRVERAGSSIRCGEVISAKWGLDPKSFDCVATR
jgi:hypothetical protein